MRSNQELDENIKKRSFNEILLTAQFVIIKHFDKKCAYKINSLKID